MAVLHGAFLGCSPDQVWSDRRAVCSVTCAIVLVAIVIGVVRFYWLDILLFYKDRYRVPPVTSKGQQSLSMLAFLHVVVVVVLLVVVLLLLLVVVVVVVVVFVVVVLLLLLVVVVQYRVQST